MSTVELTPALILRAYSCGLFPMAESKAERDVFWVDPETRGVIPLDGFHVPRRLARTVRAGRFRITVNRDFPRIVRGCARRTGRRPESWINGPIFDAYCALHRQGHAHSVEAWQEDTLAGGLYGVTLGAAFFGESMFSTERDASKVALVHLVARLRAGGFSLLDTQFVTSHLTRFGAVEMTRARYLSRLSDALTRPATFYPAGFSDAALSVSGEVSVQASTQMS